MPLSIKDPRVDVLARKLAALTGQTITEVVFYALSEKLKEESASKNKMKGQFVENIKSITGRIKKLKVLDKREPDEILGYNQFGLPT